MRAKLPNEAGFVERGGVKLQSHPLADEGVMRSDTFRQINQCPGRVEKDRFDRSRIVEAPGIEVVLAFHKVVIVL
jgi:hypothetical protein